MMAAAIGNLGEQVRTDDQLLPALYLLRMLEVFDPDLNETANPKLGEAFDRALRFAGSKHRRQIRKGTDRVPYVAHLLSVAALVLEAGGDEDLAIAALLHDTAEDQGGEVVLAEIEREFGSRVAAVVKGCTDTFEDPKPDWCTRKQNYIAHVREAADLGTCLVSAADKVHNARSIVTDYYGEGDGVFARFKGHGDNVRERKDRTLWYYRQLLEAFRDAVGRNRNDPDCDRYLAGVQRLIGELARVVGELERLAGAVDYNPCRE